MMVGRKGRLKGDEKSRARVYRLRERRKAQGWQDYDLSLPPEMAALLSELKQPGEALHSVIGRALQALRAQGTYGLSPDERLPALIERMWGMHDEGLSHQAIANRLANRLNEEREPTSSGRGQWQAGTVGRLLKAYPRHGS
jgi:hypothetical protein